MQKKVKKELVPIKTEGKKDPIKSKVKSIHTGLIHHKCTERVLVRKMARDGRETLYTREGKLDNVHVDKYYPIL